MPDAIHDSKKLVPIREAAIFLDVSIDTIRRWDKNGILKAQRPGGKMRCFLLEDLEKIKFSKKIGISEASRLLKVSQSTLRRLELRNLIKPERGKNSERLYNRDDLNILLNSGYFIRQRQVAEEKAEAEEELKTQEMGGKTRESHQSNSHESKTQIQETNEEVNSDQDLKPRMNALELLLRWGASVVVFLLLINLSVRNINSAAGKFDQLLPVPIQTEQPSQVLGTEETESQTPQAPEETPKVVSKVKIVDEFSIINIRQEPATTSAKIGEAYGGDTFELVSKHEGWYEVKIVDELTGFISADYLIEEEENN